MILEAKTSEIERAVLLAGRGDIVKVHGHDAWRKALALSKLYDRGCEVEDADMDCYDAAMAEAER